MRELHDLPAVILAAGAGSRLQNVKNFALKPLTRLLGLTLLERVILTCRDAGVREFFVVVGYQKDKLLMHIMEIEKKYDLAIKVVDNPLWEAGNGTSVSACSPYISDPFLLLMCDHLFEPKILKELVAADGEEEVCRLAVDRKIEDIFDPEDATMVQLEGNAITAINKGLKNPDAVDTGLFLCRPLLFPALDKARLKGDSSLSGGISQLIESRKIRSVDVSGSFWLDVDTPESLRAGEDRLLKKLKTAKRVDGPISRYINRFFSLKLTRRLAPYPISPNQMTLVATLVGLLGVACFFGAGFVTNRPYPLLWIMMILAGVLIQIASILDGVDGELARLKHQTSIYGAYVDTLLDRYIDGAVVIGMVFSSYMHSGSFKIVLVGFIALLGIPLPSMHTAMFAALAKREYDSAHDGLLRFFPCSRDVRLFAIFVCALLNKIELALYFLAFLPNFVTLFRLVTVRRVVENETGRTPKKPKNKPKRISKAA